jgi:type IX secretion system PorP/SprF family membrane protein
MYRKIIYLFLIAQIGVSAQQIPLNSLYSYNILQINPATAGIDKGIEMNLSHRQQWLGFDGAPVTTWLTSQMQLSPKIGLGFSMAYDKVAFLERFNCQGSFAYHLKINKKNALHMGMSLGILQGSMNLDNVISSDASDPILLNPNLNGIAFNSQFGIIYSYKEKLNIGISFPQLFTTSIDLELQNIEGAYDLTKHRILYFSYLLDLSEDIAFKPLFLIRNANGIESQWDLIGNFNFKNNYWGGIGIREQGGFLINMGMNIIEELGITYAYEFNRNGVASFSSGSHEIMVSYLLGKKKNTENIEEEEAEQNTESSE